MSIQTNRSRHDCTDNMQPDFDLPSNTRPLQTWLDEQQNFVTVERSYTPPKLGERTSWDSSKTVTELKWLHPDYEEDTRACYDTQAGVMSAWEDKKFPSHNTGSVEGVEGAHLYTWSSSGNHPMSRRFRRGRRRDDDNDSVIRFEAVQHSDGHGVVQHYRTIAALRTRNGTMLVNEQDFASGGAVMTRPDEWDYELPLGGIEDTLLGHPESLYDITDVVREETLMREARSWEDEDGMVPIRRQDRQTQRVELSTGAAVIVLWDPTANNSDERKCGFYLPPEEATLYDGAEAPRESLQPIDVKQALERDLVLSPANEFVGDSAGFSNDDQLGEVVIRQGEWYLVPMPEDFSPDAPIHKPLPKATRDSDWDLSPVADEVPPEDDLVGVFHIDGLPTNCPECGSGGLEIDANVPLAECPDCSFGAIYDDEEYERYVEERTEQWRDERYNELYQDALDTLNSHRPRDLAVTEDAIYVRGTFRHIGNEHQMVNLDDRWHLAAENTRDVNVFDLSRDTVGTARVE